MNNSPRRSNYRAQQKAVPTGGSENFDTTPHFSGKLPGAGEGNYFNGLVVYKVPNQFGGTSLKVMVTEDIKAGTTVYLNETKASQAAG